MTSKDEFTDDEWGALLRAPIAAGSLVVTADADRDGLVAELRAMARRIRHTETAGAGHGLVEAIVADLTDDDRPIDAGAAMASDRPALEAELRKAAGVIDNRAEPGVAEGYKAWLHSIARAVADAAKEGSFLGIGGVRVTDEERAVLERIDDLLGLDDEVTGY